MPTGGTGSASIGARIAGLALVGAILVLLAIDLLGVRGRGGRMSTRDATVASLAWVGISLAFFGALLPGGHAFVVVLLVALAGLSAAFERRLTTKGEA